MKIQTLIKLYPLYTEQQLRKLRSTYNNIKGRCNTISMRHHNYHNVEFKFIDIHDFINFIIKEKQAGRDYFSINKPHVSRLFDKGEYSAQNCIIRSGSHNSREANACSFKVYESLTGKTSLATSLSLFYKYNKHLMNLSLTTFYRKIKKGHLIPITDGVTTGYIKIEPLK